MYELLLLFSLMTMRLFPRKLYVDDIFLKKADREFKNELSYGQNDNSTKDINTASNKVIEKNNSSNKYGVSSYSIKNQKMNYECGEGESL